MGGISFYVCIGKPAWRWPEVNRTCVRIIVGPVSLAVVFFDIERAISGACKILARDEGEAMTARQGKRG